MDILTIVLLLLLIVLSAFFSGSEIAYAAANKIRLRKAAEEGNKKAKTALYIADNYTRSISTILIGNNLVNIAAASASTVLMMKFFPQQGELIATIGMTVLILIFGEITPKIAASEIADRLVLTLAYPLRGCMILFYPLVAAVTAFVNRLAPIWTPKEQPPQVTQDELCTLLDTIEEEGVFTEKESELIKSAIEFPALTAKDILIPRVDVTAFDIDDDIRSILSDKDMMSYSRFPVYKDSIDNVIGILSTKQLVKALLVNPDVKVEDLLMPPLFVHMTKDISSILKEFRRTKAHMAVVVDEFGGMMGILTIEDIIEEIVGDIFDESDEVEQDFIENGDGVYTVDGGLGIYELFDMIDYTPKDFESEYSTVGGWATEMLDKFPDPGDTFSYERLTVTVTKAQAMRVEELRVELAPEETEADDEEPDQEKSPASPSQP